MENNNIITEIMQGMLGYIDNAVSKKLKEVLEHVFAKYTEVKAGLDEPNNEELIDKFISAKRIEGCSEKTLSYYKNTIEKVLDYIKKDIVHITTDDLRGYFADYQGTGISKVTVDNVRRNLSSFFSWLEEEDYILKSPIRRIHKVKITKTVKETFSDEELQKIRDNCNEVRDLAMVDLMASSGLRVGELVLLNRSDIDFQEREAIVLGKGDKERVIYFDARTKIHLKEYLDSRKDNEDALFVSLRKGHKRMSINGIESRIRKIGRNVGLHKVHPHKFRRTFATQAVDKGMPIEQLQQMMGHIRVDTTLMYAMVKQSNVKIAHRKYVG